MTGLVYANTNYNEHTANNVKEQLYANMVSKNITVEYAKEEATVNMERPDIHVSIAGENVYASMENLNSSVWTVIQIRPVNTASLFMCIPVLITIPTVFVASVCSILMLRSLESLS